MRFGLAIMNDFPPGIRPADRVGEMREQVAAARETGFASVWMLQHYLGSMPTLQPLPTLAAMTSESGSMDVGTNMLILPLHHPVEIAELYATLDHLSGGHAVAGFGMGYRENEFAAFGIPLEERKDRYEESVELVRALWSGETVHHEGRFFRIDGERISLVPVRPGGPPIWVGAGAHRAGALRAARLGDAWIIPPHVTPERLRVVLGWYGEELERLGKPAEREVVVRRELVLDHDGQKARDRGLHARGDLSAAYGAYNAPDQTGTYKHLAGKESVEEVADTSYLFGTPEMAVDGLKELEEAGVTYVVLRMQWYQLPQADVLSTMQLFRDEVLPHFS